MPWRPGCPNDLAPRLGFERDRSHRYIHHRQAQVVGLAAQLRELLRANLYQLATSSLGFHALNAVLVVLFVKNAIDWYRHPLLSSTDK